MSSSDTGSRKRLKDKKHKKGSVGELNVPNRLHAETTRKKFIRDETIHVQKDVHVGGNILSKLIFVITFLLLGISLMYILNQNNILGGTNSDDGKTTWLTNLLTFDYFWSDGKQQPNDDIEPEEISEYNYWDYLFPFLSFIQKTYEEPENFEKNFAEEDETSEKSEMTKESKMNDEEKNDDHSDDETSSDRNHVKNESEEDEKKYHHDFEDNRDDLEEDQDEDDEETRPSESFSYSKSSSSFKFDTHKYGNEENYGQDEIYKDVDYGKDESDEEEGDDNTIDDEENQLGASDDDDDDGDNDGNDDNNEQENDEATSDDENHLNESDESTSADDGIEDDNENHSDESNEGTSYDGTDDDAEESPDSSNKDQESDVDGEPTNEDQTESSNVITKLGVGVALIFVAYTVIIRKWNNYVIEEPIADDISEDESVSNQNLHSSQNNVPKNENETFQEYSESPSTSESEDEPAYSPDTPEGTFAHELEDSESYASTSASDAIDSDIEPSATFDRYASSYNKANITNEYDWRYKDDLDDADEDFDRGKLDTALEKYEKVLQRAADSVRARYGLAKILDRKAEMSRSNNILAKAINAYEEVLNAADVPDLLFKSVARRLNDRMRFKGEYGRAIRVQKLMIERFPDEVIHRNDLIVTLLMLNRMSEAEKNLEEILRKWPTDGMAMVHYGFVLKLKGDLTRSVNFLKRGIDTLEPGTQDGRFYYHLGDALQKLKRNAEAMRVYEDAVIQGVFPSKYQRSLYNIDRLSARPWWTLNQSTYSSFFKHLETNWIIIRDEALQLLEREKDSSFHEEAEQLREIGDWKQLELYSRGVRSPQCDKVPFTCDMVGKFHPAAGCRRGQVKFSIMEPGTHVWPHCGPTNCRLRAHLGLIIPSNVSIRVANEIKTWEEGKVIIFDDSFEHEVWHNGTTYRLILIVDVWHPELTEYERKTLSAI